MNWEEWLKACTKEVLGQGWFPLLSHIILKSMYSRSTLCMSPYFCHDYELDIT